MAPHEPPRSVEPELGAVTWLSSLDELPVDELSQSVDEVPLEESVAEVLAVVEVVVAFRWVAAAMPPVSPRKAPTLAAATATRAEWAGWGLGRRRVGPAEGEGVAAGPTEARCGGFGLGWGVFQASMGASVGSLPWNGLGTRTDPTQSSVKIR